MVVYNRTKGPIMLYVRDESGTAVSVELKAGARWECPDECTIANLGILVKRGDVRVREE